MMALSESEELLVATVRSLPKDIGAQITQWAVRLAELADGKQIDWSDTWTDEDLRDASMASFHRLDETECR